MSRYAKLRGPAMAAAVLTLAIGLTSSGSFSRVDGYLQEHCPVDSELAREVIDESR